MKKIILQYSIEPDTKSFKMPIGAEVLCVQIQRGRPQIWALCDCDSAPDMERKFKIVGTGVVFRDKGWKYVGTFQICGGDFIWHLFMESDHE